jgi:hypothetical protein
VPRGILRVFINVLDENVFQNPQILRRTSVANSVLKFQYRGRYNTGISKMSIPALAGIEFFSRNIPLPLKKVGKLMSKPQ